MKALLGIALLLATTACSKQPQPAEPQMVLDEDTNLEAVPMATEDYSPPGEGNSVTESDLDNASDAMMRQQAQDEQDARAFEILNTEASNDIYVVRDKATGCEFIKMEDQPLRDRPDGKGGQRGCHTGTDK